MQPALGYGWFKSAQYDFRSGQEKGKESFVEPGKKEGRGSDWVEVAECR